MKLGRAEFLGVVIAAAALCAGAQEARWIWYPGDYGIWWGGNEGSELIDTGTPSEAAVSGRALKLSR